MTTCLQQKTRRERENDGERDVKRMHSIMAEITAGDIVGLSMVLTAIVLLVMSIVWAIRSKGCSLGPMGLSIAAAFISWMGTAIAHFL